MDLSKLDKIKINFITGHARSGTTLLMVILNQHKNCISSPEIHHFIYFYKKYRNITKVTPQLIADYKKYVIEFMDLKRGPLIGPFNDTLLNELKPGDPISYNQVTKLIYLCLYGEKGIGNDIYVIVDKNPYYTFHIDKIFKIFPDARMLSTVRDYRAYILSNKQSQLPLAATRSVSYYSMAWNVHMRKIEKAKKKYGDRIKVLRYEDMVENKELEVKNMVEYFGLDFSEKLFDFYVDMKAKIETNKALVSQHERMIKKMHDLSLPINPLRVNAWKEKLTLKQIEKADTLCTHLGIKYGYKPLTNPGAFQKLLYKIIAVPAYLRITAFEILNSPEIFFYTVYGRARRRNKHLDNKLKS